MSDEEIHRANLLAEVNQGKRSQKDVAGILGVTDRHLRRLYKGFLKDGLKSLVSGQRGKSSNNRLDPLIKARVEELVTIERYAGFRPTLMTEKLEALHNIVVSRETVRKIMTAQNVWQGRKQKSPVVVHQQRIRRSQCGELVQIDGSDHLWFEDRGPRCTLIAFIDDATGQAYAKFCESETTVAYMTVMFEYIKKYGRMLAVYSDRHGIFRVNKPGQLKAECQTQFGRATKELGIQLICANSSQAKGRVERFNETCQDRLIKELRLAGISNIEEANKFLTSTYLDDHNKRFAKPPIDARDAHQPPLSEDVLRTILCHKEYRKVSKNLEFQYKNVIYQIASETPSRRLIRAQVMVLEDANGLVQAQYKGVFLPLKRHSEQEYVGEIVNSKEIDRFLRPKKTKRPGRSHRWV